MNQGTARDLYPVGVICPECQRPTDADDVIDWYYDGRAMHDCGVCGWPIKRDEGWNGIRADAKPQHNHCPKRDLPPWRFIDDDPGRPPERHDDSSPVQGSHLLNTHRFQF
jgi:Zn ribbon nucleic-acid-binding protein